jgi:hypothetical protein
MLGQNVFMALKIDSLNAWILNFAMMNFSMISTENMDWKQKKSMVI